MANLAVCSMFFLVFFISQTYGSKTDDYITIKHVAFFIFGDSFLDSGNNIYINTTLNQAIFWPYGETYFKFPNGRSSDGRLISDFIAEYANLPMVPPYLQPVHNQFYSGSNFASGGAGALVDTLPGLVIPLKTQARNFKKVAVWLTQKLGEFEAKILLSKSVYMFWIGSNDYSVWFNSRSDKSCSRSDLVGMVVRNVTSIIKEIYKKGARKFAFINLPPLGCLPQRRMIDSEGNSYCLQELSSLTSLHNQALFVALFQLEMQLKDFKFSLYNYNADLTDMINHPRKYGFKEGKSACCGSGLFRGEPTCGLKGNFELCGNPNEHLFWDSGHPTECAYKQLASRMWGYPIRSEHTIGPYTIKELFQAPEDCSMSS